MVSDLVSQRPSKSPSFSPVTNARHSSRLSFTTGPAGFAELRISTDSPRAAISTHAPVSHCFPVRQAGSPAILPPITIPYRSLAVRLRFRGKHKDFPLSTTASLFAQAWHVTSEGIKREGRRLGAGPHDKILIRQTSGNLVEITELGTSQELPPFVYREFIDRSIRIICTANKDVPTPTRYSDACTAVAGTRDVPCNLPRSRGSFRHQDPFLWTSFGPAETRLITSV